MYIDLPSLELIDLHKYVNMSVKKLEFSSKYIILSFKIDLPSLKIFKVGKNSLDTVDTLSLLSSDKKFY